MTRPFILYIAVAVLTFSNGLFAAYWFSYQRGETNRTEANSIEEAAANTTIGQIPNKRAYICEDRILKPIWAKITGDRNFQVYLEVQSIYNEEMVDCANEFTVSSLDVNNDGTEEMVVKANWGHFCGMYSGCWFGIFKETRSGYSTVFTHGNVFEFTLGKKLRHGFKDLNIVSNAGNGNFYKSVYEFNGEKYEEKQCFYGEPKYYYKNIKGEVVGSDSIRLSKTECSIEDE